VHEAESRVEDFLEPTPGPEHHSLSSRDEVTGKAFPILFGIQPTTNWQPKPTELVHITRVETNIGINPHEFIEPVSESLGGQGRSAEVNRRVAVCTANLVTAPFQFG
jgi:hypothetical protein